MSVQLSSAPFKLSILRVALNGGTYNAFAPTNMTNAEVVILQNADFVDLDINGIQNSAALGGPGRILWISSDGPNLNFAHASAFAAATNRMWLKGGAAITIKRHSTIGFIYNDDIGIWVHVMTGWKY